MYRKQGEDGKEMKEKMAAKTQILPSTLPLVRSSDSELTRMEARNLLVLQQDLTCCLLLFSNKKTNEK